MLTLFILPRRGLYQLTICQSCGHIFECANCDAKLVTYRKSDGSLELFCHQCQTHFDYPDKCPKCGSTEITSKYGAIDELVEVLEHRYKRVVRFDKIKSTKKSLSPQKISQVEQTEIFVTTRLFDPAIIYEEFNRIIFVNAENLLASPDYLVQEDVIKSLGEVFLRTNKDTEIVFDIPNKEAPLIQQISKLGEEINEAWTIGQWYQSFLQKESALRKAFGFPPHKNILLLTTQEKKRENSFQKLKQVQLELKKYLRQMPEIEVSSPYPARFFRRKNLYSHHLLVKYPRKYDKFAELRDLIVSLGDAYKVQVRLNPRHLF